MDLMLFSVLPVLRPRLVECAEDPLLPVSEPAQASTAKQDLLFEPCSVFIWLLIWQEKLGRTHGPTSQHPNQNHPNQNTSFDMIKDPVQAS